MKKIIQNIFSIKKGNKYKVLKILGLKIKFKKKELDGFVIEISGICNSKCPYCCTGSGNHKTQCNFMSAEKFDKIIKYLITIKMMPKEKIRVSLYNWGEPFLNPEINAILHSLKKYNKTAGISSNFIKLADITPDNYKNISAITLSICSLDPNVYKRIYGADLHKVLDNFDKFLENKNKYNPEMAVSVNWLKYKFNEQEKEIAKKYFGEKGVEFGVENYHAYLADGYALIKYFSEGCLDGYDINQLNKDIDIDRIDFILNNFAPKNYRCNLKDILTINEMGQLATCCAITSKNMEYNLGDILSLNYNEILTLKKNSKICTICDKTKLPWYYNYGFSKTIEELQKIN